LIVCPACNHPLAPDHDRLSCAACGRTCEDEHGVLNFASEPNPDKADYDPAWFEQLDYVEERHFWFRARRAVILALFRRYARSTDEILEVGSGTGSVAAALAAQGYRVAVSDVHRASLEFAGRKGLAERYLFDLTRPPFQEHFDVVGLFDVLEHLTDDHQALAMVRRMLKPGGRVVITVPAHQWLWGQSDVVAGHKRRYGSRQLEDVVESVGLEVVELRGLFLSLVPLLAVRALLNPARECPKDGAALWLSVVPVANEILYAMLSTECHLLSGCRPHFGGSFALVARRP